MFMLAGFPGLGSVLIIISMLFTGIGVHVSVANLRDFVKMETLPQCTYEDASSGPLPCKWDASEVGNGIGRDFWVDSKHRVHYVRYGR